MREILTPINNFTKKIKSVMLIDSNNIDIFINCKILEHYGVTDVVSFKNVSDALYHLQKTSIKYNLVLTDIYFPLMDGFEFADKFIELELNKKHGEIVVLSASVNPSDKEKAKQLNIEFIEKPFSIDKLFKMHTKYLK